LMALANVIPKECVKNLVLVACPPGVRGRGGGGEGVLPAPGRGGDRGDSGLGSCA
jgi:hypothetical protein